LYDLSTGGVNAWGTWTENPATTFLNLGGYSFINAWGNFTAISGQPAIRADNDGNGLNMELTDGITNYRFRVKNELLNISYGNNRVCEFSQYGLDCENFGLPDETGATNVYLQSTTSQELEINISDEIPCTFNSTHISCLNYDNLPVSGGGNPFDQWLNTTDNILFNNINVTENYASLFDEFGAGHNLSMTGQSNIALAYGGCQYAGNPGLEFLCYPTYNWYDKAGMLNITGNTNLAVLKLGEANNFRKTEITGNANLVGGTNNVGNQAIEGDGNLVWGTGSQNLKGIVTGSISIGNQNWMGGSALGSGAFGQLQDLRFL